MIGVRPQTIFEYTAHARVICGARGAALTGGIGNLLDEGLAEALVPEQRLIRVVDRALLGLSRHHTLVQPSPSKPLEVLSVGVTPEDELQSCVGPRQRLRIVAMISSVCASSPQAAAVT